MIMKVFYLTLLVGVAVGAKLPPNFKRCYRKDSKCLKDAVQDGIPKFSKGFKSLGVFGIDPLSIPQMEIPGGDGAVKISQKVTDGKLYGLSTAILDNFVFDVESGRVAWTFKIPNVTLIADYEMTGQVMVLPVKGKGKMQVQIVDVNGDEKIRMNKYRKNNEEYVKINDTVLKMEAGRVVFNLENVFDGNKQLSDQINQVMNDNWSIVFDEIKEGYNDAIRRFVDHIVDNFFGKIPISEIFLD